MRGTARATLVNTTYTLTQADSDFLNDLQKRAFQFFVDHSDADTGLTQDRARADGRPQEGAASIAATGFALTAWCIADSRGWVSHEEARRRIVETLSFAANNLPQERGWFYHFSDPKTGKRAGECEVSTIDTALFLQGAVFAREYIGDRQTTALVNRIYSRIDWQWALNGGKTLSLGWLPETGFIPYRWDSYSELMGMYLLGIGAPKQALPSTCWSAWRRGPQAQFAGETFIQCSPLFTHQYSHAWFDFRGEHDAYADYWQNSVDATLAQRAWSAAQSTRFHHWSKDVWGLTASDSAHGYVAWGTPEKGQAKDSSDGTLVPCAPAGSLPFAPRECLTALRQMKIVGGPAVWGRYGFADAFNPETGWVDPDVIAIDQGITLIMAENLRSGIVWKKFMQAPEVRKSMDLAGFSATKKAVNLTLAVAGIH